METWYFDRQPDGKMRLVNVEEENHGKFRWFLSTISEPFSSGDLQEETGLSKSTAVRYLGQAERVTGFNVGSNCGKAAGQTVDHAHIHLMPRRNGDLSDPRGGVRGVIPDRRVY